jgi:hypothetical protein
MNIFHPPTTATTPAMSADQPAASHFASGTVAMDDMPEDMSSFFFPGQFPGRAALAAMAELAKTHARVDFSPSELARRLGVQLPKRLGVTDLMRVADLLGLKVGLNRVVSSAIQHLPLPVLLISPDSGQVPSLLVATHCDGRYLVTHDHSSVIPANTMEPLSALAPHWAPTGKGWVMWVESHLPG